MRTKTFGGPTLEKKLTLSGVEYGIASFSSLPLAADFNHPPEKVITN
jgi:hypothetical protein